MSATVADGGARTRARNGDEDDGDLDRDARLSGVFPETSIGVYGIFHGFIGPVKLSGTGRIGRTEPYLHQTGEAGGRARMETRLKHEAILAQFRGSAVTLFRMGTLFTALHTRCNNGAPRYADISGSPFRIRLLVRPVLQPRRDCGNRRTYLRVPPDSTDLMLEIGYLRHRPATICEVLRARRQPSTRISRPRTIVEQLCPKRA
ncbi:hypothetical protein KM043_007075 [Ampulex compressa]|nr:hypothetical protein KM043_007075 [Ampulex compressa]